MPLAEGVRAVSATAEITDHPEPAVQKFYRVLLLQ
jgi:hypothetical protein